MIYHGFLVYSIHLQIDFDSSLIMIIIGFNVLEIDLLCLGKVSGNIRGLNRNLIGRRIINERENFVFLLDAKV